MPTAEPTLWAECNRLAEAREPRADHPALTQEVRGWTRGPAGSPYAEN